MIESVLTLHYRDFLQAHAID